MWYVCVRSAPCKLSTESHQLQNQMFSHTSKLHNISPHIVYAYNTVNSQVYSETDIDIEIKILLQN